ncbi:peptidoglycan-binding domain-containing protein [Parenemella sanctibonifatiensis]|uniref:Peptidoglycan binding-like domain-containing protein n=1 Tax=Parenemella sanctibonifatiensis TaxID=2016505 RepID=A0A255EJ37_9ACTN|nr:peptidoglycan-binding domain-containing protein [Parenemella sanctibonifatiensis]OYN91549.1 hypothetical protein CGZ92_00450 [Parenemella sanctibonifatiensis]
MSTRRLFLQGAAMGGIALGAASVFGAVPATAAMPTDRINRNLSGLGYTNNPKGFQADHRLVQDGKIGPVSQSVLAAMVALVQIQAGATMDSSWGDATTSAVKSYQSRNGLVVDGKAGPKTMAKMNITRVVGLGSSSLGGSIRRTEVIQRAAYWPNIGLGYSRSNYYRDIKGTRTYRQDCSGQVSNAFHATQSYSTRSLDQITSEISKASLRPGDILNSYDYHTVVFCGWANSARTAYYSLEESGSKGAIGREVTSYPFFGLGSNWKARRYSKIVMG